MNKLTWILLFKIDLRVIENNYNKSNKEKLMKNKIVKQK